MLNYYYKRRLDSPSSTPIYMSESKSFLLESRPNEKLQRGAVAGAVTNGFRLRRAAHPTFSQVLVREVVVLKPVAATKCPEKTR